MKMTRTVAGLATIAGLALWPSAVFASFTHDITAMINGVEKKVGFISQSGSECNASCTLDITDFLSGSNGANKVNFEFNFPNIANPSNPYTFTEDDLYYLSYDNVPGQRLNIRMEIDLNHGYDLRTQDTNMPEDLVNLGRFTNGGQHEVFFYETSFSGPVFNPSEQIVVPAEVPLPAAFPLFGSAIAFFGITAWRARRKQNS